MGDEERVEQCPHRRLFVGIEQFRGFKGEFQAPVVTQSSRPENQLVTGRRQCGRQLTQYAERGFGLSRFVNADLVGEHVERFGERRLGEAPFAAQPREILRKTHAPNVSLAYGVPVWHTDNISMTIGYF